MRFCDYGVARIEGVFNVEVIPYGIVLSVSLCVRHRSDRKQSGEGLASVRELPDCPLCALGNHRVLVMTQPFEC
jgi:hypothetical protein